LIVTPNEPNPIETQQPDPIRLPLQAIVAPQLRSTYSISRRQESLLLLLTVSITSCLAAWRRFDNTDGWHHLFVGRWIALNRTIPKLDSWTFTSFGLPWIPHEWLYQLSMFLTFKAGGFPGLAALKISLAAMALFFLAMTARAMGSRMAIVLPLIVLTGAGASYRFLDRPHMATFALTALTLYILESWCLRRVNRSPAEIEDSFAGQGFLVVRPQIGGRLWLLTPIYWVWANCHAGVVYGWMLLGIYGTLVLFRSRHLLSTYLAAVAAALTATLAGPNGINTLLYPYITLSKLKTAGLAITEFRTSHFDDPLLWLTGCIVLVFIVLASLKKVPVYQLLLILFVGFLALRWPREQAYLFLVAMPFVATHTTRLFTRIHSYQKLPQAALITCTCLWIACISWTANRLPKIDWNLGNVYDSQPKRALEFAEQNQLPKNVLTVFRFSGITEWLMPQHKVFYDSRFDLFPVSVLKSSKIIMTAQPGYAEALRQYNCEWLFLDYTDTPQYHGNRKLDLNLTLAAKLFKHPDWTLIYWDDLSLIYLRADLAKSQYPTLRSWKYVNPVLRGADLPAKGETLSQAISELQAHESANPGCLRNKRLLGLAFLRDRQTSQAAERFRQTLQSERHESQDYYNLAYALDELGVQAEALMIVNQGLLLEDNSTELLDLKGILLAKTNRLHEAIETLEKASRIGPADSFREQNLVQMRRQLKASPGQR
jgi:hypothetical protein